ncbi:MAG: hypothetical protein FJW85_01040 [Actinobacteria bacterium]|nr:hypothetical protein [Actinomycetota bacterium]
MKARWLVAAFASGTLALAVLTPGAVTAGSPESRSKPSGEALIHIGGGTARAVERGVNVYRIVVSSQATISLLGQSRGKPAIGTFGGKALVDRWTRLGHSASSRSALSTIVWGSPGEPPTPFVGAYVAKPRINSQGQLTFLAKTSAPLPATLPNFSLNIERPVHKARTSRSGGYPLVIPVYSASSTVGAQLTGTGDNAATIVFGTVANGNVTTACPKPPTQNMTGNDSSNYATFAGTCGDTTWSAGTLSFFPMQGDGSTIPAQVQMTATLIVKGGNPSTFTWNVNMGQWKKGAVQVWPK